MSIYEMSPEELNAYLADVEADELAFAEEDVDNMLLRQNEEERIERELFNE